MKVIRANLVLSQYGADHVDLLTDLPSPTPGLTDDNCWLGFIVARDQGADYLAQHFPGIPVNVVNSRFKEERFSGR